MKPSYQLTPYPIGSIRETWAISWPLMLGFLSISLMMFADRLLLAHASTQALNAAAHAGMVAFVFLVPPIAIASISEVFVGRAHGKGEFEGAGQAVWQMLWFAGFIGPLLWVFSYLSQSLFFYHTGNEALEKEYFFTLLAFAPFFCSSAALTGFFIGIGRVTVVTICTFIANFINIGFDVVLIFGYGPIPEMGVAGAAIATGLAQVFQTLLLLILFFGEEYRKDYGTKKWRFHFETFAESLKIGLPSGLNLMMEMLAHVAFFRLMIFIGTEALTASAVAQSFLFLLNFLCEGLSKAVTTLTANLIGGNFLSPIGKVLRSAIIIHVLFFIALVAILLLFPEPVMGVFFSEKDMHLLQDTQFMTMALRVCLCMCLFFLFDGISRIFIGQLTAAGDTRFVFYVGLFSNWVIYVLPVFIVVYFFQFPGDKAWFVSVLYGVFNLCLYFWRYRSGKWLTNIESKVVTA